jgi:CheY-like chemotaxis protein
MLEREGHIVVEAADGAEALDVMERNASRIDLLVTDLMMPGVSGRELIARFRERHAGVPIICMTGFAPEREMSSPFAPEVHTVLAKPFTYDVLKRAVASALTGDGQPEFQAPVGGNAA